MEVKKSSIFQLQLFLRTSEAEKSEIHQWSCSRGNWTWSFEILHSEGKQGRFTKLVWAHHVGVLESWSLSAECQAGYVKQEGFAFNQFARAQCRTSPSMCGNEALLFAVERPQQSFENSPSLSKCAPDPTDWRSFCLTTWRGPWRGRKCCRGHSCPTLVLPYSSVSFSRQRIH